MTFAYDGASMFDLAAAKAAAGIIATVYIVGSPGGMPHADAARVSAIRAAGMGALPNWERAADYFLTCSVADAKAAGVEALSACRALGFPADGSIQCAFSIDVQVPRSRFAEIGQKVDAIRAGLTSAYQVMVYAQSDLIDYLVQNGHLAGKQWLMGSTWDAPYNVASPNVCMVQSHDAAGNWLNSHVSGTDVNTVTDPSAVKAWWPDGSPYATPTNIMEAIMALAGAPADYKTFLADVQHVVNNPQWNTADGPHSPDTVIRSAVGDHVDSQLAGLVSSLGKLATSVAALTPVQVTADLASAVVNQIKGLAWKLG